jgi:hypothetical protein
VVTLVTCQEKGLISGENYMAAKQFGGNFDYLFNMLAGA